MFEINEDWSSINNRQIIDILIGDTNVLPYWTGSQLSGSRDYWLIHLPQWQSSF